MALRRIKPMLLPSSITPRPVISIGKKPELVWAAPTDLYVDETYQRDLSRKSVKLIRQLATDFRWNRMKPPIVVRDGGKWHVVDGQHTAIAAATIGVKEIPVFVVEASSLDERARAFVGHNTDRIIVSPINIYRALLAFKDPDAMDVAAVCARAGVRIREFTQSTPLDVGDTKAIGLIRKMIKQRGVIKARMVLETLVRAKRAPIGGAEIYAADYILNELHANQRRLAAAIRVDGDTGILKAHADAKRRRATFWRTLAQRWVDRMEERAAA